MEAGRAHDSLMRRGCCIGYAEIIKIISSTVDPHYIHHRRYPHLLADGGSISRTLMLTGHSRNGPTVDVFSISAHSPRGAYTENVDGGSIFMKSTMLVPDKWTHRRHIASTGHLDNLIDGGSRLHSSKTVSTTTCRRWVHFANPHANRPL